MAPEPGSHPSLTAGGTSAQHLAAYKELSYKQSHFISTTPWEGRGLVPITQMRTPRLRQVPSPACSGQGHTSPSFGTSITDLGERRHTAFQWVCLLHHTLTPSHPPAIMLRSPGWAVTQDGLALCCGVLGGCFYPQSSASQAQPVVELCGHPGAPPLGPSSTAFLGQEASTSLCPSPISSPLHQHLSSAGFETYIYFLCSFMATYNPPL